MKLKPLGVWTWLGVFGVGVRRSCLLNECFVRKVSLLRFLIQMSGSDEAFTRLCGLEGSAVHGSIDWGFPGS